MNTSTHQRLVSFIWGIADDVLRDLYVRGKYRDVILPMVVLRRLDSVLDTSKQQVLDTKKTLDAAGIVNSSMPAIARVLNYPVHTGVGRALPLRAHRLPPYVF